MKYFSNNQGKLQQLMLGLCVVINHQQQPQFLCDISKIDQTVAAVFYKAGWLCQQS